MLVSIFFALIISTAISFAGSVQLGPVNFGTIYSALHKNKKSAILFGFGGSLPELLYCGLAFGGSNYLLQFESLNDYLKYLTSAVLFIFGVYLIFQKPHLKIVVSKSKKAKKYGKGPYSDFSIHNYFLFGFL